MNTSRTIHLLVIISVLILPACTPTGGPDINEFAQPDPETYVSLMPVVREYFFLRKQAVLTEDLSTLYARFPELQRDTDIERGVNAEAHHAASMQSLAPFDGNIHPEYYQQIKIKRTEGEVQVLVHGMELYLWKDADGVFGESGGEFKIVLYLRQQGDAWQVYRTDQVTLQEWHDFEP